jgi:hypothetical protein
VQRLTVPTPAEKSGSHPGTPAKFAIALAQAEQGSVINGDGEIRRFGLVPVDRVGL